MLLTIVLTLTIISLLTDTPSHTHNFIEEKHSDNNHEEPSEFSIAEDFMADPSVHQKEHPYHDHAGLVDHYSIRGRCILCHIDCEPIEQSASD